MGVDVVVMMWFDFGLIVLDMQLVVVYGIVVKFIEKNQGVFFDLKLVLSSML